MSSSALSSPGALQARIHRWVVVTVLGFASGLPLALTGQAMQAWLSTSGVDIAQIGFLAIVGLPYTFKFLWAPLMDRFEPPWLGRRRGWLVLTQLGLAAVLLSMSGMQPARDVQGVLVVAAVYLASLVAAFVLEYTQTWLLQWVGQRIMFDMRMQIYRHLHRLDLAFYDRNPVGRLMTRVTTDVDVINDLFTSGVVSIFGDVFTLVGIMAMLVWMDARLALVAMSVLPLLGIGILQLAGRRTPA